MAEDRNEFSIGRLLYTLLCKIVPIMGDGDVGVPEENWKFSDEVQIPPFRNLDEFLLGRARFQLPPFRDFPKWNNRILTNLLYFQTNYFAIMLAVILISCACQAQHVVFGLSSMIFLGAALFLSLSTHPTLQQARSDHPFLTLIAILISLYYFLCTMGSVLIVVFIILMPSLLVLIHASLRLRDLKAKINRQLERTGLKTTLMSRFLSLLNVDLKTL